MLKKTIFVCVVFVMVALGVNSQNSDEFEVRKAKTSGIRSTVLEVKGHGRTCYVYHALGGNDDTSAAVLLWCEIDK